MNCHFIGATEERCTLKKHVPAPLLRRSFRLEQMPDRARLSVCGLGFYMLYLNGENITKGPLAPYISNPNDLIYYDTYDLLPRLREGENVIRLILGNGFMNPFGGAVWDFDRAPWIGPPRVALELEAWKGEACLLRMEADGKFRTHPSPVLFDELRLGEAYDARCELPGWNLPDFDDSGWQTALQLPAPLGELRLCRAQPVRTECERPAVRITRQGNAFLYDFGINSAGSFRLCLRAQKGQTITVRLGERLTDGVFDQSNLMFPKYDFYREWTQKCVYTAKGEGVERYEPHFTYYGFRYALVEGISEEQATEDLLTYLVMHSALRRTGGFSCSDPVANTLFSMAQNADLSNFYYFPTDCPHREKNGWTGDAAVSARRMLLLYDAADSFRQWLENIRKSQNAQGALPGIVPTGGWGFEWGNGPAWDRVLFVLSDLLWRLRGDTDVIRENADAMLRYLRYILTRRSENGTVAIGLGDWVPTGKARSGGYDTPLALTDSIMVMDMARRAAEMFAAVGRTSDASFARDVFRDFRQTVRRELLDRNTMMFAGATQTGQALALCCGVPEPEERQAAFDRLLELIARNGGNFDCGFLGLHCLFDVLSEFGQGELAYRMVTKSEYPSYGCLIDRGETAMVEAIRPENMDCGSHNHHFLCDYARWMMECVAGLRVIDSQTVAVRPDYISVLDYAEAWCELPAGRVRVRWERRANEEPLVKMDCPPEIRII